MKSGALALGLVVLCMSGGPPMGAENRPCALVCLSPDEKLDAKKCACVRQGDVNIKACGLVCPDGETLDAAKCVCVGKN